MAGSPVPTLAHALCRHFVGGQGELAGDVGLRMDIGRFNVCTSASFNAVALYTRTFPAIFAASLTVIGVLT